MSCFGLNTLIADRQKWRRKKIQLGICYVLIEKIFIPWASMPFSSKTNLICLICDYNCCSLVIVLYNLDNHRSQLICIECD